MFSQFGGTQSFLLELTRCISLMWLRTMASIDHLGARDDRAIRIRKVFDEIGLLRSVRPMKLLRSMRSKRLQDVMARNITTEDFRFLN